MPGMNKHSYTVSIIQKSLDQLESDPSSGAMEALGIFDELRRLERKWREQVEQGSPRRIESDFATLNGWYRRWIVAAKAVVACENLPQLRDSITTVESTLANWPKQNVV